jgi:prophage regulatory protein
MEKMMTKRILRGREVDQRTGLGRTLRYELERKGKFPKRRKLSERATGYLEADIDEWIANRPIVT